MTKGVFRLIPGLRVHDAAVTSVRLGQSSAIEFRRLDGSCVRLAMSGCSEFGTIGFRSSAIVSTVQVFSLADHLEEVPIAGWRTLVGDDFIPSADEISALSRTARLLVSISCSYGGELAVMCDSVAVEELAS